MSVTSASCSVSTMRRANGRRSTGSTALGRPMRLDAPAARTIAGTMPPSYARASSCGNTATARLPPTFRFFGKVDLLDLWHERPGYYASAGDSVDFHWGLFLHLRPFLAQRTFGMFPERLQADEGHGYANRDDRAASHRQGVWIHPRRRGGGKLFPFPLTSWGGGW